MNHLTFNNDNKINWGWKVNENKITSSENDLKDLLYNLDAPLYFAQTEFGIGVTEVISAEKTLTTGNTDVLAFSQPIQPCNLGDPAFKEAYGVKYAYHGGAMANGIASVELVVALAEKGFLSSFGAAGLVPDVVETAILSIQQQLKGKPFAVNLIHAPTEEALERGAVERFLKLGVTIVEASAYLGLTEHIVWYRLAGLSENSDGSINISNRVIAKISRTEVAQKFMSPAPEKLVNKLLAQGKITQQQADLSKRVPMADDITAEADSGGHTDNRPFITLLPSIISLRDAVQKEFHYAELIRVGAGGGIGTPESVVAAFSMGAAYVVVGSINQSCIEAGASEYTRKLLAKVEMADMTMAPAADMFEMGVKLQVVKKGTMFAMRANKLYETYIQYDSIEDIPAEERVKLEQQIFKQTLDDVWVHTIEFFNKRDPEMLARAQSRPKRKMALIFRWYLGLSSYWSNTGEKGREMDYQIWSGPSLGAFNSWVSGSYLEDYQQRKAADIAMHLFKGAAYLQRVNLLKAQGLILDGPFASYKPEVSIN